MPAPRHALQISSDVRWHQFAIFPIDGPAPALPALSTCITSASDVSSSRQESTFFVGGALPALAALNHQVQGVPHRAAHNLVVELLGHVLVAESESRVRLEEHELAPLGLPPLQHLLGTAYESVAICRLLRKSWASLLKQQEHKFQKSVVGVEAKMSP